MSISGVGNGVWRSTVKFPVEFGVHPWSKTILVLSKHYGTPLVANLPRFKATFCTEFQNVVLSSIAVMPMSASTKTSQCTGLETV